MGTDAPELGLVTRIVPSREAHDCCVTAIAMYTGHRYEDVLRQVVLADAKGLGRNGLRERAIRRVLRALETPYRWRTEIDWDDDYGLVRFSDHLALLRNGLIVEHDTLWDVADWRRHHGYVTDIRLFGIFTPE